MMVRWRLLAAGLALLACSGCENQPDISQPDFGASSLLAGLAPADSALFSAMEGVYRVVEGSSQFGDSVVVKQGRGTLGIFAGKEAAYLTLRGGVNDSAIILEGTWRYAVSTQTGLVRLTTPRPGSSASFPGTLRGSVGTGNSSLTAPLVLQFKRPFRARGPFWVLAHRCGGRNSDYLGASENSVAMISRAEERGATGIEMDVRLSQDGIPFIYHDADINLRLTQESVLWGPIESYTWAQLRTLVRLKYGEPIPSLDEALDFVVRHTTLRLVWLDLKATADELPVVVGIQQKYLALARSLGRDLEILAGLPEESKLENLLRLAPAGGIPCLCELDVSQVRRVNASVWAPRWTLGTLEGEVNEMHAEGRRVFTWTLDGDEFIARFIAEGQFDGILTNYPGLVVYHYYKQ